MKILKEIRQSVLLLLMLVAVGAVMAQGKIYYVTPTGAAVDGGWTGTMTLTDALNAAKAGDQVWVQGFEQIDATDKLYITPTTDGFTLKSGVQLYGGFAGTETNINDRETLGKPYQMKYRSVLSGDIGMNDAVDNTSLIFPANTTRNDNATHVLSLNMNPASGTNNNTSPTVVNGFSIGGGQADGANEYGGGIYISGDNTSGGIFRIERCFLLNNYGNQGGAIYVDAAVKNVNNNESLINQCVIYNNAAGERSAVVNAGGGIYLAGEATVVNSSVFNNENGGICLSVDSKVLNSTVARNTGAGIDLLQAAGTEVSVLNSIVWGNTLLSAQYQPVFKYSAFHEVVTEGNSNMDSNGNIYVAKENRGELTAPMFDAPSVKTSFDRDFNWPQTAYPLWSWNVLEGSVMIDSGNNDTYQTTTYGSEDMAGNQRVNGSNIDIGAYEYQQLATSRVRYVMQTARGTGDGSSWANASGDLQKMIDELAQNNPQNLPGEVWVAEGKYAPQSQLISGTAYSASFRMRDGVSVYGGFKGTETTKRERKKGTMPWDFTNVTIFEAAYYDHANLQLNNNKWTLTSDSRHVVWLAPMSGEADFGSVTTLDGVTIQGGYAQGGTGLDDFKTDRGAGVYMDGANAYLTNCIVKENYATGNGGGVYLRNGRVETSLIYNNNADADGGAVYVDNRGLVLRSMLANNSAHNGAGVYLHNEVETINDYPEYLILSTCVVSNNTMSGNGAVYCDKGGVLMQNTITNNNCVTATDATSANASQTGGIYVDEYALVVNSVIWNNQMGKTGGTNIPMYVRNPSASKVRFLYNAISGVNNAVWNYTLQEQTLSLVDDNTGATDDESSIGPRFTEPADGMNFDLGTDYGVQEGWKDNIISYYWKPISGSNLWGRGMALGQLPEEVVLTPEMDIEGNLFAQKPAVGAFTVEAPKIVPSFERNGNNYKLVLYVDVECTEPSHDGSSWETAYRSLNDAIAYCAALTSGNVTGHYENNPNTSIPLANIDFFEIRVLEGDLWPRYAFTNNDPKTATITVPVTKSGKAIEIYGGYHRTTDNNTVVRDPLTYRSIINGNTEAKDITQGLYHCITVQQGAKLVLDGFHVINGYAAGEASRQYGAGLLAHAGSTVTVRNCIFENNTAQDGAAIDAREAKLTLQNCVVNNNTNTDANKPVINAQSLTMNHVTVVNNVGAAPADMGASSFSAGNTSGTNSQSLTSTGEAGAKNFANPTNKAGATLGFDTYLGGYSVFRPLTSSTESAVLINKASGTSVENTKDITTTSGRDLGGIPDLGAYEAILPEADSVLYVSENGAGNMDGSSWENAIAGNLIYDINVGKRVEGNISTTDSRYIGFFDASARPYGETSGASKLFFEHLNEQNIESSNVNYITETHDGVTHVTGANGINIRNKRQEQYVGGLQYAVEVAATNAAKDGKQRTVWVAGGTYTDYKGFVIRDKVDVLGGFPNEGNPGEDDRHPLVSQYIPTNTADAGLEKTKYETIIQIQEDKPYVLNNNSYSANNLPGQTRKPVLFQPDVCLPTKSPSGRESSFSYWVWEWVYHFPLGRYEWVNKGYDESVPGADEDASNTYRWENQEYGYVEYSGATWDGFTIRHGFYTDYKANRDGGAGVRMFRGVTLQNCVVTDNYINAHNNAGRGAGIYCDGNNSKVINCFVLNNVNDSDESYGGGMYMILGTSYNTMVANNYAKSNGGGIFIEDAMFYNNTVAYNSSNGTGGLHQWTASSGTTTTLKLYNTIFYGNTGIAIGVSSVENFNGAWNCYVQTASDLEVSVQNKIYASQQGTKLSSPFESANAQAENNYRLNSTTWCLNNGAEDLGKDYQGSQINLPSTDVDFTNRIKDCAVDIGAYERENNENIKYTNSNGVGIYYVSQNGAGLRSGENPANAACAMKLQDILTDAGKKVNTGTLTSAIVKVAGYENASYVYHANTLASASDPQSYTYVVPEGVTLMGGYYDGTFSNGVYQNDGWDEAKDDYVRNPLKYQTVLSAANSSTIQTIRGYHAVTFGTWPGTAALAKETIIDGLWLIDGSATSMAGTGNPNTRGGGAIVPSGAHVRNCVVMNCEAIEGGGLYLLPGATVSGTAVIECEATNGAGIYAGNTGVNADSRAHILSCTIANNEASSTGGGLYMEDGAVMSVNTVVFDNRAGSDKNVSGVVSQQFEDSKLATVFNITNKTNYYPFNNCFVETQEMPSDFENRMLDSDKSLYFADDYYRLKDYSFLIKHGMKYIYQRALETTFNVAALDMQNIKRNQYEIYGAERLDAGAFAYEGGILPTDLFTRIFVSPTTNVTMPAGEDMGKYLGRSFYTSFSTLEDALGYIRSMRSGDSPKATDRTQFEILVAGGTYKPSYLRTTGAAVDHDQKLYSFVVPQGVSIYGGFSGTEMISSKVEGSTENLISIPGVTGEFACMGDITKILSAREYSDFNQNNILEPWELANQTILSGQINASSTAQNAYHVVFTEKGKATTVNPVVLDGLTVMYGQTDDELSYSTKEDEQGRGGGIYSSGVTYTISRCRLQNNTAVRGGAVFIRNADLNLSGCILVGNKTVANKATDQGTNKLSSRGGAAYVSGIDKDVRLRAVNTLWANNESAEEGGAIGTNYADGLTTYHDPLLYIMNNTFVRNKATTNPVIYAHNGKSHIVNTLIWGNQGETYQDLTDLSNIYDVSHSASDVNYVSKFGTGTNLLLSTENMGDKGPRFTNPSTEAGVAGNSASSLWNPVAISVLTDAGDGTEHTANKNPDESDSEHGNLGEFTGAYQDWFNASSMTTGYLGENGVTEAYITGGTNGTYSRYSGPYGESGTPLCKPIDIGVYEYQYFSNFSTMTEIYVDTISRGNASGDSWANATDDLRGAIVGAANPSQEQKERFVYVHNGNYSMNRLSAGSAYTLDMLDNDFNISLTLKGSCTGSGEQQDFSKPTVLRNDGSTERLMSVLTNSKPVTIEGFTFINTTEKGVGMDASTDSKGSLTLKNCGFRISNTGLKIATNSGKMLIYNTLFADGGTGLNTGSDTTTVVNATFANNNKDIDGTANVYNSVSWNNTAQNLPTGNNNVAIAKNVANDNINEGPNFRDPDNGDIYSRDYRIRPSVMLLNKGSNESYMGQVGVNPANDKDLGNNARLVDNYIDVGAYEYEAPLQPIIYVKPDLTGTADGQSWETALGDLQGAVDLAGLYALNNNGKQGYVFVHGRYQDNIGTLNLTLGNTKVYGGMNDEKSTETETEKIVSDLLSKRKGMLDANNRSSLGKVTIGADGVIDGFVVTGAATINEGVLSTSVVKNDVGGAAAGLLYNSLVLGSVSDIKAVNVTATGTIAEVTGNGNNRASATTNSYVTDDYWKYQLMETSKDIDAGTIKDLTTYTNLVGHERDLIGNKRIRNTVDNGCFETWNISNDYTITADDYPVGKSVVYVRSAKELGIEKTSDGTLVYKDATSAFNPGFLLLEHQAGLRGNGNHIRLTNFAVERDIPAGGADLVAMPFDVNSATSEFDELIPKRYDGNIRAAYDYKFDGNNGEGAWTTQDIDKTGMYEGLLFENTSNEGKKLRFYGKSSAPYVEDGNVKYIELKQYNHSEPWTSPSSEGQKFTHKENMGWNLFGSPYLCAMNYSDMQYGRVLYSYNNDSYQSIKTYDNDGNDVEGHIPAGSAVFTQTATLRTEETFSVAQSSEKRGTAYAASANLKVQLQSMRPTKSGEESPADEILLDTTSPENSSTTFDLASDGVKWMSMNENVPQIYMQRSGGRYSLLSAVNEEGEVEVGVRVGSAGTYLISLADGLDLSSYQSVLLTDLHAGKMVDLMKENYPFEATRGGDMEGRFRLSFNRNISEVELNVRLYSPSSGTVVVEGLPENSRVHWFQPDGRRVEVRDAFNWKETFYMQPGIYMMEVYDIGEKNRIGSYKIRVK